MKDTQLDKSLRSAKPEIQPKGAFTAQVMERIGAVQAPRRRRRLANTWMWAATATTVFAAIAVFILSPTNNPNQIADNSRDSQANVGVSTNPDNTDSISHARLAKQVQEDIDAIYSGISSIDSAEYGDSGLSEAALYN